MTSDPNIIYGGDLEETIEYSTLGELLINNFKDGGEKDALINGISGEKWTYNDLLVQSSKMAKALHGAGVRQNDVISVLSENRLEYAAISYGTFFLNAIFAPTNFMYTERELEHTLNITKPKLIFVSTIAKGSIPKLKELKFLERIILLDEENVDDGKLISFKMFVKKHQGNDFDVEKYVQQPVKVFDQVAVIFMSSGTTGLPKGVGLTHGNLIACILPNLEKIPLAKALFGHIISVYITPWFHVMGFMGKLMFTTSREYTQVFLPKFIPELYLECIQKYKPITIAVPPPIISFLAKTPMLDKYDLSSLKIIFSGAAPLTKDLEDQVKKRFNDDIIVLQAYGQTECTLGVLYSDPATAKPGSVGQLVKGIYGKVVDENGNSLGPNKVGELCFKGPLIMKGYIDNIEATTNTIDKDGWLHSGDLGYYDEDSQFFIVDRLKELIKYKGFQVAPAEIEGLLISNPKIQDAGVIGIPDERAGELPFAFVVKEPGTDLTEQEVIDYVAKNVSDAKWLRGGVKFIDEIPKNISGKILRREMRELYKSMKSKL